MTTVLTTSPPATHRMPANAVSVPHAPAQPDQDTYGPTELGLFKSYTRESFRAAFGSEAPPYDPSRVIKTWFDSTVDASRTEDIALYSIIAADAKGQWGYRQLVMPASEAASVNLPGAITYPAYAIAPTKATRAGSTLWPERLSLEVDARALLTELGITAELSDLGAQWSNTPFPTLYGDEPRREWIFVYRGNTYNAGGLLRAKNEAGIGAPGRWRVAETIDWLPDPPALTGLDDTRAPRPMPVRALLPNEVLGQSLMGPAIVRTDRRAAQTSAAGHFTESDRALLLEIRGLVGQLLSR